jgi:hypothetical protein
MPERLADAIDELAQPNRPPQEEPQIHADPALRRPRLLRNTPAAVALVIAGVAAVAAAVAKFWALGLPAVSDRLGFLSDGLAPRIALAAVAGMVVGVLVTWAFRPWRTVRGAARSRLVALRRRTARVPLFVSVTLAVLLTRAIGGVFVMDATPSTAVDVVKAASPAIAAVVIAVALVVAYRRQRDAERAQFEKRFGAASAQLGDSDVAVRVAGVYAMAAVADESPAFARRQQCIDVLCGYLRLPYDPDSGDNNLTEFVSTTTWAAQPPATHIEELRRQHIRQNDREVRNTIIRVLARHLKAKAETSWSGNDFDFSGVLFESAVFDRAKFSGRYVSFDGATFAAEDTSFEGATFSAEEVSFDRAEFGADTSFAGAEFQSRFTSFDGATFGGEQTSFEGARFGGEFVYFRHAAFGGEKSIFTSAKFKCLRASFDSPSEWNDVEFDWDTSNVAGDSLPTIPRSITPRPWPPELAGEE